MFISDVAAYHVFECALFSVQGDIDCSLQTPCTENNTHKHTICCCITDKYIYNDVFTILTCNFSKEQYVLPEDDLRIETFRSILSVLMETNFYTNI
jgi:hypothetical protein